jgi:hypothetical protein
MVYVFFGGWLGGFGYNFFFFSFSFWSLITVMEFSAKIYTVSQVSSPIFTFCHQSLLSGTAQLGFFAHIQLIGVAGVL